MRCAAVGAETDLQVASDSTHFVESVRTAQGVSKEILACEFRRFRLLSAVYYEQIMSLDIF